MTFICLLLNLRMNRLNMHIYLCFHSVKARCLSMTKQDLHAHYVICLCRNILILCQNVCVQQAFPTEQNYGSIIAIQKGASSVMQNYIKLSTHASPPSILQESLKNSRRHQSPFKSHYQSLPNVLGLSRWFMTPPLMDSFCFVLCENIFFLTPE